MLSLRWIAAFVALCLTGAMSPSLAQNYPDKLIRLVIPNSPGSSPDNVARAFSPVWSKIIGQPVVIEHKPGAGGVLGTEYAAKSVPADGYNILFSLATDQTTFPVFVKDLRFDPIKDLVPVLAIAEASLMLASPIPTPWNTFAEMVAYAKANPGKLNVGTPGAQTSVALQWAAIAQQMGLDVVPIAYNGGGPFIAAIVAGQVHLGWMNVLSTTGPGKGKVKVIAVTGAKRDPVYPDVPTFAELGMPRLVGSLYVLNVPTGTPRAVIDKINSTGNQALQQPEVRDPLSKVGFTTVGGTAEAAAKRMADLAQFYVDITSKLRK